MMKHILIAAVLMISGAAHAKIQWNITGGPNAKTKIGGYGIEPGKVWILTDDIPYLFPLDVIRAAGFSLKEFMDLLEQYDKSDDLLLTIQGTRKESSFEVKSITSMFAGPMPRKPETPVDLEECRRRPRICEL